MCSLSKEQSILSRETIQNAFISELCPPLSTLTFCPLLSTPQASVGTRMKCSCFSETCSTICQVHLCIFKPDIVFNAITKSIDTGQPEQIAQVDLGRNVLLLVSDLHAKRPSYYVIQLALIRSLTSID